jgi:ribonuclease HI
MSTSHTNYTIYTDGGCIGNPGPGGYGAVIQAGKQRKELSGGYQRTTNNRMELMAAIAALGDTHEGSTILLYSDSRYLVDGMTRGWAERWRANNWRKADKQKALNVDLWRVLLALCERRKVTFKWVAGHAGNKENERCDRLSMNAANRPNLPQDTGYVGDNSHQDGLFA